MSRIDDKVTVVLNVNGQQPQDELRRLSKSLEDTNKKLEKLRSAKADPKAIKSLEKQAKKLERQLELVRSESENVKATLLSLDKATPKQLEQALRKLKRELRDMKPNSEAWDKQTAAIKKVEAQMKLLNAQSKEGASAFDRFNRKLNDYQTALMGAIAAMAGFIAAGRKAVGAFAEMDEQMANTKKYTGLTQDAVIKLNDAFKKMDTRTSRDKLNDLAQEAGRLGKNTLESVKGYVEAAEVINVALVDLGEGATQTIAKLTNIFGVEQTLGTKQAMLSVGSAVNVLSQNCTASKPYLVEFAQRMAGIGSQAGLTIPQILAFGAVLDANGQKVEMSATAIQKVIMNLANKNKEFAQTLGLDAEKLSETLKVSAKDGLLMFLQALHDIGEKSDYNNATLILAPAFKEMGLDAARVSQVLSTLAKHIDEVKWQIGEADKAFKEASSASNEYKIFNNTVQAGLDKAKKSISELAISLGEKLMPVMRHVMTSTTAIMKLLNIIVDFIIRYRSEILAVSMGLISYTVAVNRAIIAEKALAVARAASSAGALAAKAANFALIAIYNLLTLNVGRAAAAFRMFSSVLRLSPIGIIISLITAAAAAFIYFSNRAKEAAKVQREINKAISETNSVLKSEQSAIDDAFNALKKAKKGSEEYRKAKDNIISQYGQYLSGLISEKGELLDIEKAYYRVSRAAREAAVSRGMDEARSSIEKDFNDRNSKLVGSLRSKLAKYLVNEQELEPLMTLIMAEIKDKGAFYSEEVLRPSLKKGAKENSWNEVYGAIQKIEGSYKVFDEDIKLMQSKFGYSVNEFLSYSVQQLKAMKEDLSSQIEMSKSKAPGKKYSDYELYASGALVANYQTRADAYLALDKIEKAIIELSASAESNSGSSSNPINLPESDGGNVSAKDRFKAENEWLEKERALVRINYATGISDYREYVDAMNDLDIQYHKKILDRSDLSELERISSLADLREAEKKALDQEQASSIEELEEVIKDRKSLLVEAFLAEKLSKEAFDESMVKIDLDFQRALVNMYEDGSDERLKAEQKLSEMLMEDKLSRRKKVEEEEKRYQEHLNEVQSYLDKASESIFGPSREKIESAYKELSQSLEIIYNSQLQSAEDNEEAKALITEKYLRVKAEMIKQYEQGNLVTVESVSKALVDSTEDATEQMKKAIYSTYDKLVSGMSSIFSQLTSLVQAESELQQAAIESRYEKELKLAEGNAYLITKLEIQKEKDIAAAKSQASKKMYSMQIMQAVAQSAQSAINAYSSAAAIPLVGYLLAPIAASMALAAGALQIAVIKKQSQASEAKGYAEGGFTSRGDKYEPVGIVHAGEWVASQELVNNPHTRPFIDALEAVQRGNRIGSIANGVPTSNIAANNNDSELVAALDRSIAVIERLERKLSEPFISIAVVEGDKGIKKAQDEYDRLIRNVSK